MNKILLLVALFACATYASICHSWGDPHNRLLNGRGYDLYNTQGDYTFLQYKNVLVQERVSNSQNWGTNSLLIGAAVRVGRKTFEILNDVLRINKKVATIAQVKAAGVQVTGNVFTISTQGITIKIHNHVANDAKSGKNYLSLYVDVPAALQKTDGIRMRGLCVSNESGLYAVRSRRRSLFATKPKFVTLPVRPRRVYTAAQSNAARAACKKTGLRRRSSINNCVFDYLRATDKNAVLRAYAGDRKDNVALRKIDKKNNKKLVKKNKGKKCRRVIRKLRRTVRKLRRQLRSANRAKRNALNKVRTLNAQNASFRGQINSLNIKIRNADNTIRSLKNDLARSRINYNNAIAARNAAQRQVNTLRAQLSAANSKCDARIRSATKGYVVQINSLNSQLRSQNQRFQDELRRQQQYYQQYIANMQRRFNYK